MCQVFSCIGHGFGKAAPFSIGPRNSSFRDASRPPYSHHPYFLNNPFLQNPHFLGNGTFLFRNALLREICVHYNSNYGLGQKKRFTVSSSSKSRVGIHADDCSAFFNIDLIMFAVTTLLTFLN